MIASVPGHFLSFCFCERISRWSLLTFYFYPVNKSKTFDSGGQDIAFDSRHEETC